MVNIMVRLLRPFFPQFFLLFGVFPRCPDLFFTKKSLFSETWPKKYETLVGERGIRLSGGQRQRIGIARALYKQADVIVFDEATSALDNETEQAVMESIESLGKDLTILIIAHRLTTLKKCNQIVELSNGKIKRMGTYNEIVSLSE